jgi:homopolymeric O-antigen transport system ATP-binding protein
MSHPIIEAENVSKRYRLGQFNAQTIREEFEQFLKHLRWKGAAAADSSEFWALKNVSFTVQPGEVVGIIGRNGAGKSTLLKILSRVTEPTSGEVRIRGRVASLLEVGTGFHPDLTGRENIYLNGTILGMTKAEVKAKFDEIVAFAETERFLDTPVKRYSSGMYVRLAFAIAAHLEPEVLIVDEVLAVGDAEFQKKCLGKMRDVSGRAGRTVLFVSHNMSAVMDLCSRAILIDHGMKQHDAQTSEVIAAYLSPIMASADIELTHAMRRGAQRYASLKRLRLFDGEGNPASFYPMNKPFVARIELECTSPVSNVQIGIKITSQFGPTVHYLASSWEGISFTLDPGLHTFEVKMPHVMMFPGTYMVGPWVSRGDPQADDDYVPEVATITVVKGNVNEYRPPFEKYAHTGTEVYAPSEWKKIS